MRLLLHRHRIALQDALRHLWHDRTAALLSICVIGVTSGLALLLYLAIDHVRDLPARLSVSPQVTLFLSAATGDQDRTLIEEKLRTRTGVKAVRFLARDQALAELARALEAPDLAAAFTPNPLPDALVVTFVDDERERLLRLKAEAETWSGIDHVQLDDDWARRLEALMRAAHLLLWVLGAALVVAVIGTTFLSVGGQMLRRAAEIEVQTLLGATAPYVRRPLVYFGMLQGLLGGAAGASLLYAAWVYSAPTLAGLTELYGLVAPARPSIRGAAAASIAGCAALGALGALGSTRSARALRN